MEKPATIELTPAQRQVLAAGKDVHLVDPDSHQEWVAVRAEVFKRLKHLIYDDGDTPAESAYALADEVFKEDWDDPKMAEYDHYEDHRK